MDLARRDNIIVINGDGNRSGIVRGLSLGERREDSRFVIYGTTGNGILQQRTTEPPTMTQVPGSLGWDRVRGNAETVLKHYVNRHLANPFDAGRTFQNLVVAEDLGRGKEFPWQTRFQPLYKEMESIGNFAEMGFSFFADITHRQWVFDVVPGADRTKGQELLSPVVFRTEHSSIDGYRYVEDFQRYRTTGYALGSGEDENRMRFTIGAEFIGRDRWEVALDCGSPDDMAALIEYGTQRLAEYHEVKSVEVDALPRAFRFERDYFLGDLVSVYISRIGLELDTRITSVREIWERNGGYRAEIRFGGELSNMFTIWNRREEVR